MTVDVEVGVVGMAFGWGKKRAKKSVLAICGVLYQDNEGPVRKEVCKYVCTSIHTHVHGYFRSLVTIRIGCTDYIHMCCTYIHLVHTSMYMHTIQGFPVTHSGGSSFPAFSRLWIPVAATYLGKLNQRHYLHAYTCTRVHTHTNGLGAFPCQLATDEFVIPS